MDKTHEAISRVLLTRQQLQTRIDELGAQLAADYAGKDLLAVCILRGAAHFFSDLMLAMPGECVYDFAACSSYGGGVRSSGTVTLTRDLTEPVEGRHVLLIDDVLDSGLTLRFLRDHILQSKPASVRLCVLLDKPQGRREEISADYVGFTIAHEFVVGYGLDYDQRYRNLPYVGVLKPEIYGGK